RVLTFRVSGDVDPPPERQRLRVEALGQRGLAGADDAGQHQVRGSDQAPGIEHPRVINERATAIEVLAHEHPIAPELTLSEERVGTGEGGGGVLMARQPQTPRRAQGRRARLTSTRQITSRAPLGSLRLRLRSRLRCPLPAGLGSDRGGGLAALLAQTTPLTVGPDQDRGVQTLLFPVHSPHPRRGSTGPVERPNSPAPVTPCEGRESPLRLPGVCPAGSGWVR